MHDIVIIAVHQCQVRVSHSMRMLLEREQDVSSYATPPSYYLYLSLVLLDVDVCNCTA